MPRQEGNEPPWMILLAMLQTSGKLTALTGCNLSTQSDRWFEDAVD